MMRDVGTLLEAERATEQQFAAEAARELPHPDSWSASLLLFHVYRWRERLRDGLSQLRAGKRVAPPADVDGLNAHELEEGCSMSLSEAAERADHAQAELIELWKTLGDRPYSWYIATTTGEALLRNGYTHPRNHLAEHYIDRGDRPRAAAIFDATANELRKLEAPGHTLGPALCQLASALVWDGRCDQALLLLEEALPMRQDLAQLVANDKDFAPLWNDPRFLSLTASR